MAMTFQLDGRIARSPEIVPYPDGATTKEMARLVIAADRPCKDNTTDFFQVAVFGTDNVGRVKQLAAGDHIVLNGRVQQDVWNDDTGTTRYDIKFVSNNVTIAEPRHHPAPTVAAHVAHTAQTASAAVTVTAGR